MPARHLTMTTREDPFIKLFVSAYDKGAWEGAVLSKPDAIDRVNPAVDQIATRSDGKRLPIEHTIIEPFVGDKRDFALFKDAFLRIEEDESLKIIGQATIVFVPVGILYGRPKQAARDAIVQSVHRWIRKNVAGLPEGRLVRRCTISGIPGEDPHEIDLNIHITPWGEGSNHHAGTFKIARQQMGDDIDQVIGGALRKKLPKLVGTQADKRVLILERQHMNLIPSDILARIERMRHAFPELAKVDEIWFLETFWYGTAFGGDYLRFEHLEGKEERSSFDFTKGKLRIRNHRGVGEVVNPYDE
jgi:hypothetical protein